MNSKQVLRFALVGFIIVYLSSCMVSKNYQRPEMNTKNLYRTDQLTDSATLVMDSTSIGELSWNNFFSDDLLKGYIQTALDSNLDIRIAIQNINTAEALVKQGKASFAPTLFGNLSAGYTHNSRNSKIPTRDVWAFGLSGNAAWEADVWGKIRSQDKAFVAGYLQSVEAHKAVKSQLVGSIASLYYQLMALDQEKAIAQRSILSRDSSLNTTKALMDAGQVTALAVKQTEAQLYDAQLLLVNLQQQERDLENIFCVLLNESPHSIQRNSLNQQEVTTPLRIGVAANLLANRPDVRAAEFTLMQKFELTNVAKSLFYPSLTITAGTGFQAADIDKWVGLHSIFANVAGGLLQPILNHRQIRTNYEIAQAQQQQALLNYQKVLLNAGNDVSNALFDYQTQVKSIDILQKQLDVNRTAVNYSEQLLVNGLANYLEVLTARQNALNTELNLVGSQLEKLISVVNLYQSLGGGWQ